MSAQHDLLIRLQLGREGFALDVDMRLPGRGISVLFGPSGSGKTTVLRCVAGLEVQAHGEICLGDQTWLHSDAQVHRPAHQRATGYVFQEASLFPHLDVRRNIEFGLKRTHRADAQQHFESAVALLGLSALLNRSVDGLSGGERQRVAIARALATQPQVLLLDEPLSALDPARKREVLPWLERLRDELQMPMIYVTHSVDELTRLGDHLVVLDQGRVRAQGPVMTVLSTLQLQGVDEQDSGVLLEGHVDERVPAWHLARVQVSGAHLWVRDDGIPVGGRVRLRVLARDVSITLDEPMGTSIQNHLPVVIDGVEDDVHPSQVLVQLRSEDTRILARITRRSWSQLGLQIGQPVWAQVKSVAVVH